MPETVTLALGEGTGATRSFIEAEVLSRFGGAALASLEDGSHVGDAPSIVVTADAYVVDPPVFPGGDIGRLVVSGTVNDLLASGAVPWCMTLGVILGEGTPMALVRQVLDSAAAEAAAADIEVVAGDTKVLPRVTGIEIILSATGIGRPLRAGRSFSVTGALPGDVVIVTGSVGDHGLAVLTAREGLGFESVVRSDCAALTSLLTPVMASCDGLRCLRDPTRGGLLGALSDIAEASGVQVVLDAPAVPVSHYVGAGCELLGLDPMLLVNEGKMVMVLAESDAPSVLRALHAHPLGRDAAVVAAVREASGPGAPLLVSDGFAERVFVRPQGAPIPRLC